MSEYTDINRKQDFDFFVSMYDELYKQYGHKFIAIKNKKILGAYDSVPEALKMLSKQYDLGTYIIQECTGDEYAYINTSMRLIIGG